ncbi:MAG: hypothetical protein L3K08_09275 [Thermoplasmata archaeon]|nr:hypothetical protein [Thermoplasmata archaeon]
MRGSTRVPVHLPVAPPPVRDVEEEPGSERFVGRECYVFNPQLRTGLNDTHCAHCRFYLTARCPHIDEFLDDVEDLSPE